MCPLALILLGLFSVAVFKTTDNDSGYMEDIQIIQIILVAEQIYERMFLNLSVNDLAFLWKTAIDI